MTLSLSRVFIGLTTFTHTSLNWLYFTIALVSVQLFWLFCPKIKLCESTLHFMFCACYLPWIEYHCIITHPNTSPLSTRHHWEFIPLVTCPNHSPSSHGRATTSPGTRPTIYLHRTLSFPPFYDPYHIS